VALIALRTRSLNVIAFGIALSGALVASHLGFGLGGGFWLVPLLLGGAVGLLARDVRSLPAMWLGFACFYPAALATGSIAFLGENWWLAYLLMSLTASLGAVVAIVTGRGRTRSSRSRA